MASTASRPLAFSGKKRPFWLAEAVRASEQWPTAAQKKAIKREAVTCYNKLEGTKLTTLPGLSGLANPEEMAASQAAQRRPRRKPDRQASKDSLAARQASQTGRFLAAETARAFHPFL